mmetsp:Transcript_24753/g.36301  ORF Transcript_24753/g.36301 Transcript_24753/m.36301 type:complete len:475 (+) Transcript_24753:708-2132(+)
MYSPESRVDDEENCERKPGEPDGRGDGGALPLLAVEHLVRDGGAVASGTRQHHEEGDARDHEGPTVGRRQESNCGENQQGHGHEEELSTAADEDRQQHRPLPRRTEHVSVDQLPARLFPFFLALLFGWCAVVVQHVSAKRSEKDDGDHATEQEHNHHRVHDGEPVHVVVDAATHGQVHVPAGSPLDVAVSELDVVGVDDFGDVVRIAQLLGLGVVEERGDSHRLRTHLLVVELAGLGGEVLRQVTLDSVLDTGRHDLDANDAASSVSGERLVRLDDDFDVVVHEVGHDGRVVGLFRVFQVRGLRDKVATDEVAVLVEDILAALAVHGGCHRQVVDNPVERVLRADGVQQQVSFANVHVSFAQDFASLGLAHFDLVGRVVDAAAGQELAEVFGGRLDLLRLTHGVLVILERDVGLDGSDAVHLHLHIVTGVVGGRDHAWQVEAVHAAAQHGDGQGRHHRQHTLCEHIAQSWGVDT